MHADRPVWMSFYFSDFFNDSNVQEMTPYQLGLYWQALHIAWNADPPCSLPNDREQIRQLLKIDSNDRRYENNIDLVLGCFKSDGNGRIVQKRLQVEYEKALHIKKIRSQAGKLGRYNQLKTKDIQAAPERCPENQCGHNQLKTKKIQAAPERCPETSTQRAVTSHLLCEEKPIKRKKHECFFSESVWADWNIFREALSDWVEEKARYYFDLFVEREKVLPTRYKYADWSLAARAWARRAPDEWKRISKSNNHPTAYQVREVLASYRDRLIGAADPDAKWDHVFRTQLGCSYEEAMGVLK